MAATLPEFLAAVRTEALTCYEAAGIDWATDEENAQRRKDSGMKFGVIGGGSRDGGSSWQSLARGLPTIETDYLNGEIVMLGRLHGVPTPCNEALQQVANRMVRERRAAGDRHFAQLACRDEADPLSIGREERMVRRRGALAAFRDHRPFELIERPDVQLAPCLGAHDIRDARAVRRELESGAELRPEPSVGELHVDVLADALGDDRWRDFLRQKVASFKETS